jgi:hypothetical protein
MPYLSFLSWFSPLYLFKIYKTNPTSLLDKWLRDIILDQQLIQPFTHGSSPAKGVDFGFKGGFRSLFLVNVFSPMKLDLFL